MIQNHDFPVEHDHRAARVADELRAQGRYTDAAAIDPRTNGKQAFWCAAAAFGGHFVLGLLAASLTCFLAALVFGVYPFRVLVIALWSIAYIGWEWRQGFGSGWRYDWAAWTMGACAVGVFKAPGGVSDYIDPIYGLALAGLFVTVGATEVLPKYRGRAK